MILGTWPLNNDNSGAAEAVQGFATREGMNAYFVNDEQEAYELQNSIRIDIDSGSGQGRKSSAFSRAVICFAQDCDGENPNKKIVGATIFPPFEDLRDQETKILELRGVLDAACSSMA